MKFLTSLRVWWALHQFPKCVICGNKFPRGKGAGISGTKFCSSACYTQAWADWIKAGNE